jgi:uracil-DNA glycosylase
MKNSLDSISTIEQLNEHIQAFNDHYYPESKLKPILGGGKNYKPNTMFIFINPTKRNVASDPTWTGKRVPWIGITPIWKVFAKAGIISDELNEQIQLKKKLWSPEFTDFVYNQLESTGLYLTNIVKWAGEDAALPEKEKIKRFLPILIKEIELVQPEKIVCFGTIPYFALTNDKTNLKTIYEEFKLTNKVSYRVIELQNYQPKALACYFPVGLGQFNQPKAIEMLNAINKM